MHDDRTLVEARIDRILRERVRPAVHGATAPLQTEVWHVPAEPVPTAAGIAAPYRPLVDAEAWGRPWGTSWFHVTGAAAAARAVLAPVLASPAVPSAHRVSAVGHAHIDSAWLWPLRETVRKVARTVASVTALMDTIPGWCSRCPRRSTGGGCATGGPTCGGA